jgi:hypothetical protein
MRRVAFRTLVCMGGECKGILMHVHHFSKCCKLHQRWRRHHEAADCAKIFVRGVELQRVAASAAAEADTAIGSVLHIGR